MLISVCPIGGKKISCLISFDHRNFQFRFFAKTFYFWLLRENRNFSHEISCIFVENAIHAKLSHTELFSTLMCILYGAARGLIRSNGDEIALRAQNRYFSLRKFLFR